ncbi:glycosyltransferase [Rubellicoccus peritrichatus]|uniref:Glycosyltransferase n=1 Tax=Rubellicoccus peritrichatus TaxID=3080537 RepID=A0AAQ3QW17_9BACT|nr:glycosyltransferase [Puniceicoccus sp. CR14]WOO41432.1 glycosyltransferase [Puniceicoccus sp. CR14]
MPFALTVAICTYNRSKYLNIALDSLSSQKADLSDIEVFVIDNNSSDDTKAICSKYENKIPNFRYILEKQQGLSFARNRAIEESHSDYVAYLDDDSKVSNEWAQVSKKVISEKKPDAFGGPSFALFLKEPPRWFKPEYVRNNPSDVACELNEPHFFSGCNMAFKKRHLINLGGFQERFSMKGKKIAYGDDTDVQYRLRKANPSAIFWFEPRLSVEHLVRDDKMTIIWQARSLFSLGFDNYLATGGDSNDTYRRMFGNFCKQSLGFLVDSLYRLHFRNKQKHPYWQNYMKEYVFPKRLARLGVIFAKLQIKKGKPG